MIEETISMKMNTMKPKPNENIPYKQYVPCPKCSFPPFNMSVQTDEIAPHYTCMNPIYVRCPGTPVADSEGAEVTFAPPPPKIRQKRKK